MSLRRDVPEPQASWPPRRLSARGREPARPVSVLEPVGQMPWEPALQEQRERQGRQGRRQDQDQVLPPELRQREPLRARARGPLAATDRRLPRVAALGEAGSCRTPLAQLGRPAPKPERPQTHRRSREQRWPKPERRQPGPPQRAATPQQHPT
ncbi:hypothetical protein GCM10009692_27030 [Leucobacter aridicollis]